MIYVDWVEHVAAAIARLTADSGWVVQAGAILDPVDVTDETTMAVFGAIADLVAIGVVEDRTNQNYLADCQSLRAIRQGAKLSGRWPSFMKQWLDPQQQDFLGRVVEACEQRREGYCVLEWTTAEDVFGDLGWQIDGHTPLNVAQSLERLGYVETQLTLGGPSRIRPTYRGVVRATKAIPTEWHSRLIGMVDEWETTTVEFKRELDLGSPAKNGEFAHDIAALANSKASGRERYLLVGYDPKTREFTTSVSAAVTQDRLEDVLNEYSDPSPQVHYFTVEHPSGNGMVGIVEVRREAVLVPHRMKRDGGKRKAGEVYVRHGSHIEPPTQEEMVSLLAEGDRARATQSTGLLADPRVPGLPRSTVK